MIAELCMALTLGVNVGTYHFVDQNKHNNINPGLYLKCSLTTNLKHGVVMGVYKNSQYNTSLHAGYNYSLPYNFDITLGVVSGYSYASIVPVVLPSWSYKNESGLVTRLSFIPHIPGKVDGGIHLSFERSF